MTGEKNEHLIATLEARFAQYPARHNRIHWKDVRAKLEASPSKLKVLAQMEETGGEPDPIGVDKPSGEFDLKTSSWVLTPKDIRKLGGALFCDRRYNSVFLYHNGAQSYYAARGFRGVLKV